MGQVATSTLIKSWKKVWPSMCILPEKKIESVGEKCQAKKLKQSSGQQRMKMIKKKKKDCQQTEYLSYTTYISNSAI